ncbi:KIAA0930-like protein [Hypsibius exemplaris]|uniref:KIAA0930-like protein n=1 Tax=Hypsibius exemplaris TaxID=2072580 RepID=A0A1W0X2P6_HYPEX|nr:KIAA0930-like protein [Hypsibius exemplaris]
MARRHNSEMRRKTSSEQPNNNNNHHWDNDSASDRGINFTVRPAAPASPAFPPSGLLHRLLPVILEERRKGKNRSSWTFVSGDGSDNFQPASLKQRWGDIFFDSFVPSTNNQSTDLQDDLLFIVRRTPRTDTDIGTMQTVLDVIRRENIAKLPAPNDLSVEWDETVYLNLILNHLEYVVTCAVCSRSTPKDLQIIKRQTTRVFASPSRRRMDSKGEAEEICYPNLFFSIDDFEEIFRDLVIRDGEMVCVELVARDPLSASLKSVLFLGSVRYELLKQVYDTRASLTSKVAERWWSSNQRIEFVRMKGPAGKGYAEMAVSKVLGSKPSTPSHDEDNEFDFGDMEEQLHMVNRRTSDPFRQLGTPSRHAAARPSQFLRKSQSESFGPGVDGRYGNEVQAGALQDEVEEGAFDNQWGFRGLNQAWHYFKEKRRNGSVALNAHLTYVTLPWHAIINAILVEKTQPVLTDI